MLERKELQWKNWERQKVNDRRSDGGPRVEVRSFRTYWAIPVEHRRRCRGGPSTERPNRLDELLL